MEVKYRFWKKKSREKEIYLFNLIQSTILLHFQIFRTFRYEIKTIGQLNFFETYTLFSDGEILRKKN